MRRAKDVEAGAFVDDRLAAEPKAHKPRAEASSLPVRLARVAALLGACYLVGVHELVFAALTSVRCAPTTVRAGANVTCDVATGALSSDADLSITQTGGAGQIALLSEGAHAYRITFGTRAAGAAGVRVSHSIFWSHAAVEVLAGPAVTVEVDCSLADGVTAAAVGSEVRCAVTPRDAYGNAAEVEKPEGAPEGYFTVTHVGGASKLAVHDTEVSFVVAQPVGGKAGRAGVAVTLDGTRVESTVAVAAGYSVASDWP